MSSFGQKEENDVLDLGGRVVALQSGGGVWAAASYPQLLVADTRHRRVDRCNTLPSVCHIPRQKIMFSLGFRLAHMRVKQLTPFATITAVARSVMEQFVVPSLIGLGDQ